MRLDTPRQLLLRRMILALGLGVLVFVASTPAAHAGWLDALTDPLQFATNLVLSLLATLNSLLAQLFAATQQALLWILTLKLGAGVTVVGFAWTVLRDLVNLVFIILFIIISFATIFNVTGVLREYYWKQALVPLLIGAIVLNYSLAIGQAVSLLSNQVAAVAVGILPNPGDILVSSLTPNATTIQLSGGTNYAKVSNILDTLTAAEKAEYDKCLNETKTVYDTNAPWYVYTINFYGGSLGSKTIRKSVGDCQLEIIDSRSAVAKKAVGQPLNDSEKAALKQRGAAYAEYGSDNNTRLALIASGVFGVIMMVLMISCLATAFVFLAVRILVVWALLALSPLAWMGYAIPGKAPFRNWWKNFIAWNAFGPLYIFTLIPGMYMLIQQGNLLTALKNAGAGSAGGLVQIVLFQGFAVLIFIGGLALALKSSFVGAIRGTAFAGAALEKFGAFDTAGRGALRQFGRGVGAVGAATGVSADLQALRERVAQQRKDITAGARARLGIRTQEETLARSRAQLGVRGGAEDIEKLRAQRIGTERTTIEQRMKLQRAKWESEGYSSDDINGFENDFLDKQAQSGNMDVSLAAREMLMARTRIDPTTGAKVPALGFDEMSQMSDDYAKISPLARSAFVERASTRLSEKIDKKEFRNPLEIEQALASGMFTDAQKDKMLRSLARSQPLVAADLLERGNASVVNDFGRVFPGKGPQDMVAANFGQLSNADVAKLLEKPAGWHTPQLENAIVGRSGKLDRYGEIIGANPTVQATLDTMLRTRGIATPPPP